MPILQSALQLKSLFGDEWENYAAQAGVVATIGSMRDTFTSEWFSKFCGTMTVMQSSINYNHSVNDGRNAGQGSGESDRGRGIANQNTNQNSGASYGHGFGASLNMQQVERPVILPQELRSLRPGEGVISLPGMGDRPIPFFAPNFWQLNEPWVGRVGRNPLRKG